MRTHALLILSVGLLIAADAKDDAAGKELKQLAGNYVMVSAEQKGEKLTEDRIKECRMTIAGDKHTVKMGGETFDGKHKIDPTKSPKEIDATNPEGKTMLGIYKFEKGQFTVCFAVPGKERPKEFTIKEGSGEFVHVWKKAK
jgi:uncharacterized protein (TIGR03067 family)